MTQDLTVIERPSNAMMQLVDEPARILAAWQQFQELKKQLLDASDYQSYTETINKEKKEKRFVKKSGWRKIASAFGVSLETISEEIRNFIAPDGNTHVVYVYRVRAIAPGGNRSSDGVGACDTTESRFQKIIWGKERGEKIGYEVAYKVNDLMATAYTRAANRAISDLVGGGEVSAEEVTSEDTYTAAPTVETLADNMVDGLVIMAGRSPERMMALAEFLLKQKTVKFLTENEANELAAIFKAIKPPVNKAVVQSLSEAETAALALEIASKEQEEVSGVAS